MDAGETPVVAAVREFREETGIVLDKSRLQPVLNPSDYGGRHYFKVRAFMIIISTCSTNCLC